METKILIVTDEQLIKIREDVLKSLILATKEGNGDSQNYYQAQLNLLNRIMK